MRSKTISAAARSDTIAQVAKLMKDEGAGFIPPLDRDRLVGVITDRDIVIRCLAERHAGYLDEPAEHVMTRQVQTIGP